MRDVSIDEVFTWREDFDHKAEEAFGGRLVEVSPHTFSDLKDHCDRLDREADPFFENLGGVVPLNGIRIFVAKEGKVPDGVLRGRAQAAGGTE